MIIVASASGRYRRESVCVTINIDSNASVQVIREDCNYHSISTTKRI